METKKEIRTQILKQRRALSESQIHVLSTTIAKKVSEHPFFGNADIIFCYADYNSEVETGNMFHMAKKLGKLIAYPKVNGDHMEFYCVESLNDLKPGCMGILEPDTSCQVVTDMDLKKQGLVIMPGAVFDLQHHRIGYGGGYYDRFLQLYPDLHTLAVAFDFQVLEAVPFEEHDQCPEVIVTESRVLEE